MRFTKIAKVTIIISVITTAVTLGAKAEDNTSEFSWSKLMDAISQVESKGNHRAVNGKSCGIMQITPVLVSDCNNILKSRGVKKRYYLSDRYNVKKSREMFELIMSQYNPTNDIEKAIRIWNGGIHYTQKGTQGYYNKVMKVYRA